MQKVIADISTSIDGYVMGPGEQLGRLHDWVFAGRDPEGDPRTAATGIDAEILTNSFESRGAVIMGRRVYEFTNGWNDDPPYGVPCFVLTSVVRERYTVENGTSFEFVTDGAASAVAKARAAAGEKDVSVMGGARTISTLLDAGLVDELHVHIAPRLLGGGIHLFDGISHEIAFEITRVEKSPFATHVFYGIT
jgi:dihydrofolate reductase